MIHVADFGAALNGTTDDTAAFQAAINYAQLVLQGRGRAVIDVKGDTVLNYNSLSAPSVPVTLRVDGPIRVTSTLVLSVNLNVIGTGGFSGQTQFQIGPSCLIEAHGAITGPTVQMMDGAYIEKVAIWGAPTGQPCLHIGKLATDPEVLGGARVAA